MGKFLAFGTLSALLVFQDGPPPASAQEAASTPRPNVERMLTGMANAFRHKIHDDYSLIAQIDIKPPLKEGFVDTEKPTLESWHVTTAPGRRVRLARGPSEKAQIVFYVTEDAIRALSEGKLNPMTAVLATSSRDPVFIRWERPKGVESTHELRVKVRIFQGFFFDPALPHRYVLDAAHARVVHGSPAVGLYYHPGLRSAWYEVRKGKRLNEPGDTNPFHQAFIFMSGRGKAKIGEKTVEVKAGESYYIPPNSDHVVWTEDEQPLTALTPLLPSRRREVTIPSPRRWIRRVASRVFRPPEVRIT